MSHVYFGSLFRSGDKKEPVVFFIQVGQTDLQSGRTADNLWQGVGKTIAIAAFTAEHIKSG